MPTRYEQSVTHDLKLWQYKMMGKPSLVDRVSRRMQNRINKIIPEKVHAAITTVIKGMVQGVLFGAKITTSRFEKDVSLQMKDALVEEKINFYQKTAAVEGGVTGAGGILLGLADFPILIGIKLKLLYEVASIYGIDLSDYRERIYLLNIFQLAFSSAEHRREVFMKMANWHIDKQQLPEQVEDFDWRRFQQEYRDYIDIAKMAQLIPIIGAPVGAIVNYRLLKKLGITAMNAYRMRLLLPGIRL